MLEKLDLDAKLPKKLYRQRLPELQSRLHQLQRACHQAGLGSVVVFSGWDASGRGSTIKKLTERLEPRAFRLHLVKPPRTHERPLPWMWRFWVRLPNWGEMAIFHRSWYSDIVDGRVLEGLGRREWERRCRDVRFFEQALAMDRYVVVKFFLHISRKEQARRQKAMRRDPHLAWRIGPDEKARRERYGDYLATIEETLQETEAEWGPWTLVEATDKAWTRIRVFEELISRLETHLQRHTEVRMVYEESAELERALEEDLDA